MIQTEKRVNLKQYLRQNLMTPHEFSKIVGVSPSTVTRHINFGKMFSVQTARKLQEATKGCLDIDSLIGPA